MKEAAILRVELGRSRLAIAFVCAGTIATMALIAWLPGDAGLRAFGVLITGAHGLASLRVWGLRTSPRSIVAIEVGADNHVALTERGGRRIEGRAGADCYVGASLTTLVVCGKSAFASRATAILPDMLPAEDFRRLRVLLRFGEPGKNPPAS
ncbi:MAG: hypothetical protein E6H67_18050 [Betaproteobacteria bacterium]|nr:MAG: hypothetical protein E6H67_18050 [Betaproteobacteria bacterium]